MTERAVHLKLAVDVGSDPITGSVTVNGAPPTGFCGWIELVTTIESARCNGEVEAHEWSRPSGDLPARSEKARLDR